MTGFPQSAEELLDRLFAIFPQYQAQYGGPIHDDAPSFHSVLIGFASEFGGLSSSSDEQLRAFGDLVSEAVSRGGKVENALFDVSAGAPSPNTCERGAMAISFRRSP